MCVCVVTVSSSKSDSGACFPECFAAVVVQLFLSLCGASLLMLMLILILVFSSFSSLFCEVLLFFRLLIHSCLLLVFFFLVSCLNVIKTPAYMHSFHAVPLHRRNLDAPRKVCVSARCLRDFTCVWFAEFTPISFLLLHQEL